MSLCHEVTVPLGMWCRPRFGHSLACLREHAHGAPMFIYIGACGRLCGIKQGDEKGDTSSMTPKRKHLPIKTVHWCQQSRIKSVVTWSFKAAISDKISRVQRCETCHFIKLNQKDNPKRPKIVTLPVSDTVAPGHTFFLSEHPSTRHALLPPSCIFDHIFHFAASPL